MKNKSYGITLVALVVTVVVLLILAGVSINLVLGNNGIVSKSQLAAEKTRVASIKEDVALKINEIYTRDTSKKLNGKQVSDEVYNYLNQKYNTTFDRKESVICYGNYVVSLTGEDNISIIDEAETTSNWTYRIINNYAYIDNYKGTNTEVEIPEVITVSGKQYVVYKIGQPWSNNRFNGNTSIVSIKIPSTVVEIEAWTFQNCTNLRSIILPNLSVLNTIGDGAFYNTGIESLELPSTIKTIGTQTFYYCTSLASVTIHSEPITETNTTGTTIANYAFQRCGKLQSLTLDEGVTTIGDSAFSYNLTTEDIPNTPKIETLTLPNSVTSLGNYCFAGITTLKNLIISGGIKIIGEGAFYGLNNVDNNAIIPTTITSIGNYAFVNYSLNKNAKVLVPSAYTVKASEFNNCTIERY